MKKIIAILLISTAISLKGYIIFRNKTSIAVNAVAQLYDEKDTMNCPADNISKLSFAPGEETGLPSWCPLTSVKIQDAANPSNQAEWNGHIKAGEGEFYFGMKNGKLTITRVK